MRCTRVVGAFATKTEAERARQWAGTVFTRLPLQIHHHRCDKPRHRCAQWLLVSVTPAAYSAEKPEYVTAVGNGRR